MRERFSAVAVVLALTLCAPTTQAQEASGGWKQTVFIYGMGAAINGNAQIGNLKLPIDVSISDRFGWFLGYRASGFDYKDGQGRNSQRYDLTQQGPLAGIAISL